MASPGAVACVIVTAVAPAADTPADPASYGTGVADVEYVTRICPAPPAPELRAAAVLLYAPDPAEPPVVVPFGAVPAVPGPVLVPFGPAAPPVTAPPPVIPAPLLPFAPVPAPPAAPRGFRDGSPGVAGRGGLCRDPPAPPPAAVPADHGSGAAAGRVAAPALPPQRAGDARRRDPVPRARQGDSRHVYTWTGSTSSSPSARSIGAVPPPAATHRHIGVTVSVPPGVRLSNR